MAVDNNPGIAKLAGVLTERMRQETNNIVENVIDLGTIGSDNSLKTDLFPIALQKDEYQRVKRLRNSDLRNERVIVAWVGEDPIVLDIM